MPASRIYPFFYGAGWSLLLRKGAAWPASLQLHQLLFQVGVQPNATRHLSFLNMA